MKNVCKILLAAVMTMGVSEAHSQEVFKYLKQKNEDVINDPKSSEFDLKVSQYKLTCLQYIVTAGVKLNGKTTTEIMDNQALNMNIFLTNYMSDIQKMTNKTEAERKECIMKYVEITRQYPLYKDNNVETTESFVKDPGGYTPFSINVDWVKAVAELEKKNKSK